MCLSVSVGVGVCPVGVGLCLFVSVCEFPWSLMCVADAGHLRVWLMLVCHVCGKYGLHAGNRVDQRLLFGENGRAT